MFFRQDTYRQSDTNYNYEDTGDCFYKIDRRSSYLRKGHDHKIHQAPHDQPIYKGIHYYIPRKIPYGGIKKKK